MSSRTLPPELASVADNGNHGVRRRLAEKALQANQEVELERQAHRRQAQDPNEVAKGDS